MKKANFYIHYELNELDSIDLEALWKSIIWFNSLLKETFKISNIDWEIEIQAIQPKEGSIIIPILFDLALNHSDLLFWNIDNFLDFLQITNTDLYNQANQYIQEVWYSTANEINFWTIEIIKWNTSIQKDFNNFADKRPWEFAIYQKVGEILLWLFYLWIFKKTKELKNKNIPDNETPKSYFSKIKKIWKRFKGALFPLKTWDVKEIWFSKTWNKKDIDENTKITPKNMGDYLPDSEEIMKSYKDWLKYNFTWEIKNFQSSRWDFLKIKVETDEWKKLLVCKPSDWHTTEEFIQYYKKKVFFKAEVLRESMFQIPKLKILPWTMDNIQKSILE